MTANPPSQIQRLRWHGDPDEATQPDVGDVLYEDRGARIYRVRDARELIRGPHARTAHELVLLVELTDHSAITPAKLDAATVFECRREKR